MAEVKKQKEIKFVYQVFLVIFFLLLTLLFIEIISRSFLFLVTKNNKIFMYGINKDIKINSHSFSKLEFYISDQNQINIEKVQLDNKKKNKSLIWVFGGSQSKGGACGKSSSSWPIVLESKTNYKLINYSKYNVNTDFSTNLLISELEKNNNNLPNAIFWSHRINEMNVISFGLKRNKNILKNNFLNTKINKLNYYLKSINLSLKNIFLFYYIIDESVIRIKQKIGINTEVFKNANYNNENYKIAVENYKLNTIDAIKISRNYGIKNFYIISLFANSNSFFDYFSIFNEETKKLSEEFNVYYINTENYLHQYSVEGLFCDSMHQTKKGNILAAEIIKKNINLN